MSDTIRKSRPCRMIHAAPPPMGGLTLGGRPVRSASDEGLGFAADLRGRAQASDARTHAADPSPTLRLVARHGHRIDA